ncbi:MAG: tRNA-dihydrouridine synthase family protein [Marinilabiliales bacterium]|nr:tRNA-dihydrouridine synthase family protein [Marinilabiliales bacterium]
MENLSRDRIYFAPLQESTDFIYRRAHARHIGGIDKYFAPYIVLQREGNLKKSHMRDVSPDHCSGYRLVPQLLAGTVSDFQQLAMFLEQEGYEEINWNLGCPYPMVTGKGQGAGLLPHPDKIRAILDSALPGMKGRLSVKLRSGLEEPDELAEVLKVLNDFPLAEVILHPRLASQLYKGLADRNLFVQAAALCRHPLVYNGDILTQEEFQEAQQQLPGTSDWMIGRGMLKNVFLANQIKGQPIPGREEIRRRLEIFHREVYSDYASILSGPSHILTRMTKFWEFFSHHFPDQHKSFKRVKKATSLAKYEIAVRENLDRLTQDW